jgi:hypothetical protein
VQDTDRVRPSSILPAPQPWHLDRPGEQLGLTPPSGGRLGSAGPDLGYGLKLAHLLEPRLVVPSGEDRHDAVAACFACGARRSASFGRAPVIYDMEWAFTLWGFFGGAPEDLVAWRAGLVRGAGHDYSVQRRVVDSVRAATVRLSPGEVAGRLTSWQELLIV